MYAIGIDIGGTKCAACLGEVTEDRVHILYKCKPHPTASFSPEEMLALLAEDIRSCRTQSPLPPEGIGISCGGPLDSKSGRILSPPNLPGWDNIPIAGYFQEQTGLPAFLCNDANACALAEWRFGAGRGCSSMLFLTFGTGLGAGLILGGRLYPGACDMAGELGHIRLSDYGPSGYGKLGSFEGFCSGGGIAQLAQAICRRELQRGAPPAFCPDVSFLDNLTAAQVGDAARQGDPIAQEILEIVGQQLGKGLSILIDLLNPERIVIGSIFARCHNEIWPAAERMIQREALPSAWAACQVVPCELSESVGDVAALTVASYYCNGKE